MRRVFAVGILAIFTLSLLWFALAIVWRQQDGRPPTNDASPGPQAETAMIRVGRASVMVELARAPWSWQRGLMDRDALAADAGMLLIFPRPEPHNVWMKDTQILLDILWIREGRIVGITENVQPEPGTSEDALRRYPSPGPVDQILEVNAGWTKRQGITVGDRVTLP